MIKRSDIRSARVLRGDLRFYLMVDCGLDTGEVELSNEMVKLTVSGLGLLPFAVTPDSLESPRKGLYYEPHLAALCWVWTSGRHPELFGGRAYRKLAPGDSVKIELGPVMNGPVRELLRRWRSGDFSQQALP